MTRFHSIGQELRESCHWIGAGRSCARSCVVCPFTSGQGVHSVQEWVSLERLQSSSAVCLGERELLTESPLLDIWVAPGSRAQSLRDP